MDNEKQKLVKEITELLKPDIDKTIDSALNGKIKEELPKISESFLGKFFDNAMKKLGEKFKLSPDSIKKLQDIDDKVKNLIISFNQAKDLSKELEPFQQVLMSFPQIQKEKKKSASIWSAITGVLCLAIGLLL